MPQLTPTKKNSCLPIVASLTAGALAKEGAPKKDYTEAQKNACSIDAMMNGGECEACQ